MAKLYYKVVPEIDGCDECVANGDSILCDKLILACNDKYGMGCDVRRVIFKFFKKEIK